jgi:hypothetical protein
MSDGLHSLGADDLGWGISPAFNPDGTPKKLGEPRTTGPVEFTPPGKKSSSEKKQQKQQPQSVIRDVTPQQQPQQDQPQQEAAAPSEDGGGGGFNYGSLFKMAGGLLEGGANILQQQQAEKEQTAAAESSLQKVLAADKAAANALVKADLSTQLKSKNAAALIKAATAAVLETDKVAAGLSPDGQQKRLDEANRMLGSVKKVLQANKNPNTIALVKAWTAIVDKIRNVASTPMQDLAEQESWLLRPAVGKLPGYGVLVGAGALTVVLGVVITKLVRR